jgi:hypothetical protein
MSDTKRNSTAAQKQTKRNTLQFKEARRSAVESQFRQYVLEVDIDKLLRNYRMGLKGKVKIAAVKDHDEIVRCSKSKTVG